jgi:hypothetical protein
MVVFVRNIAVTLFVFGVVAYSVVNDFKTIGSGKKNDIQSTEKASFNSRRLRFLSVSPNFLITFRSFAVVSSGVSETMFALELGLDRS